MLNVNNLSVKVGESLVLDSLSLSVKPGEVHAVMGPNGSGKSTLSHVLAGKSGYDVVEGDVLFQGQDLLRMKVEERARNGLFLAFQYPVEIPGVSIMSFLKTSFESVTKARGEKQLSPVQFLSLVKEKANELSLNMELLKRSVNHGFSGGEKKVFETLQMLLLKPKFTILDETDSGLDVDALKRVMAVVNSLRNEECSWLIITHYQSLLSHIEPDYIHILCNGKIKRSGQKELLGEIEQNGFEKICC